MLLISFTGIRALCLASVLTASVSLAVAQPTANEAAGFLEQSSFGPNTASIARVQSLGFAGFLNEQFEHSFQSGKPENQSAYLRAFRGAFGTLHLRGYLGGERLPYPEYSRHS